MKVQGVVSLGVAQGLALLAAMGGAVAYATWLDAACLAVWALALGAGRAAMLLVDGGFKAALVRHPEGVTPGVERQLARASAAVALVLSMLVLPAAGLAVTHAGVATPDAALVACSVLAYVLSHALSLVSLARLERTGRFDLVGRAEAGAILLEFALPALLMVLGLQPWLALTAGVVLGRFARAVLIMNGARVAPAAANAQASTTVPWGDGLAMQGIAALSMVRDQMHLWLVGPWFGASWAGAYAFALIACALASQVLVGTMTRVAVPALRPLAPKRRALRAARALRRLALPTLPLLALTLPVLDWADAQLWDGRWQLALTVLPGLLLRMLLGLPLAVLAPWLAVALPPACAARLHGRWTLVEVLLACLALAVLGPTGLAVSWAVGGLLGTLMFAAALRTHGLPLFLRALVRAPRRPSRLRPVLPWA